MDETPIVGEAKGLIDNSGNELLAWHEGSCASDSAHDFCGHFVADEEAQGLARVGAVPVLPQSGEALWDVVSASKCLSRGISMPNNTFVGPYVSVVIDQLVPLAWLDCVEVG